jgi:hypothetical protein
MSGRRGDLTAHAHSAYFCSKYILLQWSLVVQCIVYINSVADMAACFVKEYSVAVHTHPTPSGLVVARCQYLLHVLASPFSCLGSVLHCLVPLFGHECPMTGTEHQQNKKKNKWTPVKILRVLALSSEMRCDFLDEILMPVCLYKLENWNKYNKLA